MVFFTNRAENLLQVGHKIYLNCRLHAKVGLKALNSQLKC